MIEKKAIKCIRFLKEGPFFQEYIVVIDSIKSKQRKFNLRAMNKKILVRNKIDEDMALDELLIRSNLRHAFLINQIFAFQDYDNLFYMSEHAPIKLLKSDLIKLPLRMEVVKFYSAEILSCIRYLHKKGQIYTFIYPENLFLDIDGHIKLNYSFCNCLNEKEDEILENIEFASLDYLKFKDFSSAGDYWSLGIVMFLLAIGYTPFGGESIDDTIRAIQNNSYEFPDNIDKDFQDIVKRLLEIDRTKRIGSDPEDDDLIIQHPFFSDIDWQKLESKQLPAPFAPFFSNQDYTLAPTLNFLYTTDYVVEDKDGYGDTFSKYNSTYFLKKSK